MPDVANVGKNTRVSLSDDGGREPASNVGEVTAAATVTKEGADDESVVAAACPTEGDSSERFSRLVQARTR